MCCRQNRGPFDSGQFAVLALPSECIVMRKYLRHPSDIPINVASAGGANAADCSSNLQNLSMGGMCCEVDSFIASGTEIVINIPLVKPSYEGHGVVVWCRPHDDHYELGIRFDEAEEAFKSRMVSQVCQIEHYKKQILEDEGRELDGEQAALEWISKYAADFADD